MDTNDRVQALSDAFHDGLDDIDNMIYRASERLQMAVMVRIESGMCGIEGQRTIKQLAQQMTDLASLRAKHILAHSAAEKDAEHADLPWKCPENATTSDVTPLRIVGD